MRNLRIFMLAALLILVATIAWAKTTSPPLKSAITISASDVRASQEQIMPTITWGGDIATYYANGNSDVTKPGSLFAKKGLKLRLVRVDKFKDQVEMYLRGETPYLRGTLGMINMAAEKVSQYPETKPIVVYQMTWSTAGDCIVAKAGINKPADLKGKTIAVQAYGPHVDFLANIITSAGLQMSDINIHWVEDLTGDGDTPAKALELPNVDAAMVIVPDGNVLSSGGKVGKGSEGSIKGVTIMFTTKSAPRIIADVIAVRPDYFKANKKAVRDLVHLLIKANDQVSDIVKNKSRNVAPFKSLMRAAALHLLDSELATADAEGLYLDCTYVGFAGNVKFFTDKKWPRHFDKMNKEIQSSFMSLGLMSKRVPIAQANWDYDALKSGVSVKQAEAQVFNQAELARVVETKSAQGTLADGELFSLEIYFKPNQDAFPFEAYAKDFAQIVKLAATYAGAVITVEGHSDPMRLLRLMKDNKPETEIRQTRQSAKNLSVKRAMAVRDSIIKYSQQQGVSLDVSQFATIGHGVDHPKYASPQNEDQWRKNMRVVFRVVRIEAESSVFKPL